MEYGPQVDKSHYEGKAYSSLERWVSYWHQLHLVRTTTAQEVLEVGVGGGIVARELRAAGVSVTTVDIAEDLHPDVVGSITALPFENNSFDTILAAEILEHIRYEDVPVALGELARVARTHVVISIPHPGYVWRIAFKIPRMPFIELFTKTPFFWKTHVFNGEHYWELGKKGYSVSSFLSLAKDAGLACTTSTVYGNDPAHRFFVFTKV
jgi:2-polyprenyl-3-methyl-5-hydroxy-6-metoxy-1,4-benzoquinol methylase